MGAGIDSQPLGILCLMFGFACFYEEPIFFVAWVANSFWLAGWLFLLLRNIRLALWSATIAVLFPLSLWVAVHSSHALGSTIADSFHVGYYLWHGAILVFWGAVVIVAVQQRSLRIEPKQ
jgi:hypothetical protein